MNAQDNKTRSWLLLAPIFGVMLISLTGIVLLGFGLHIPKFIIWPLGLLLYAWIIFGLMVICFSDIKEVKRKLALDRKRYDIDRKPFCAACHQKKHGIKSRKAVYHTCELSSN